MGLLSPLLPLLLRTSFESCTLTVASHQMSIASGQKPPEIPHYPKMSTRIQETIEDVHVVVVAEVQFNFSQKFRGRKERECNGMSQMVLGVLALHFIPQCWPALRGKPLNINQILLEIMTFWPSCKSITSLSELEPLCCFLFEYIYFFPPARRP